MRNKKLDLRVKLAEQQLPSGGSLATGYELFDKSDMMGSTSQRTDEGMSRLNAMASISTYTPPSRSSNRVRAKRRQMRPAPWSSGNRRWFVPPYSATSWMRVVRLINEFRGVRASARGAE